MTAITFLPEKTSELAANRSQFDNRLIPRAFHLSPALRGCHSGTPQGSTRPLRRSLPGGNSVENRAVARRVSTCASGRMRQARARLVAMRASPDPSTRSFAHTCLRKEPGYVRRARRGRMGACAPTGGRGYPRAGAAAGLRLRQLRARGLRRPVGRGGYDAAHAQPFR